MTSYPKTVKLFTPWAKAMVEGATVDRPNYGKTTRSSKTSKTHMKKRRKRRRKRKRNAKKE